mgnify:CR=1 FL=1
MFYLFTGTLTIIILFRTVVRCRSPEQSRRLNQRLLFICLHMYCSMRLIPCQPLKTCKRRSIVSIQQSRNAALIL